MDTDRKTLDSQVRDLLGGTTLVVGVGNRMRGDDGAGPAAVDALAACGVRTLDCGVAPENYLEKIVALNPAVVLFVDAVNFGGTSGDMRLFGPDQIPHAGLSTHALSLQMVCEYLTARIPARILLLGIQPGAITLNTGLSRTARMAVSHLKSLATGAAAHA
jgi:hydrogenase maturation protease